MCRRSFPGYRFTGFDPEEEAVKLRRTAQGIAVIWSDWEQHPSAACNGYQASQNGGAGSQPTQVQFLLYVWILLLPIIALCSVLVDCWLA